MSELPDTQPPSIIAKRTPEMSARIDTLNNRKNSLASANTSMTKQNIVNSNMSSQEVSKKFGHFEFNRQYF